MEYIYETKITVRYAETDCMGVVYHANYITYYEVARTEMLKSTGYSYKEMEAEGIIMPVISVSSRYISWAYYDDVLTIRVIIEKPSTSKILFRYEIFNQNAELINTGTAMLAFVNRETRRPTRAPAKFLEILETKFGKE